jgi:hypothetical protein
MDGSLSLVPWEREYRAIGPNSSKMSKNMLSHDPNYEGGVQMGSHASPNSQFGRLLQEYSAKWHGMHINGKPLMQGSMLNSPLWLIVDKHV